MNVGEIAVFLLIGGASGCVAGMIIKGTFEFMGNILAGVVGAILGGLVFRLLGISQTGPLITAATGAVALLLVVGLVRRK